MSRETVVSRGVVGLNQSGTLMQEVRHIHYVFSAKNGQDGFNHVEGFGKHLAMHPRHRIREGRGAQQTFVCRSAAQRRPKAGPKRH